MACKNTNGFLAEGFSQIEELTAMPYTFRSGEKVQTCSTIFWLSYGATTFILMAASLLVTVKQFGGRPIECVVDKELNVEVVNNFCWIHSTFSSWKFSSNFNDTPIVRNAEKKDEKAYEPDAAIFMLEKGGFKLFRGEQLKMVMSKKDVSSSHLAEYSHGLWDETGSYPGVNTVTDDSFLRYHKYVQWVAGILLLQIYVILMHKAKSLFRRRVIQMENG